jgi:hypothetical protein
MFFSLPVGTPKTLDQRKNSINRTKLGIKPVHSLPWSFLKQFPRLYPKEKG